MSFTFSKRFGRFWEDAKVLDKEIKKYPFHTTGKNERDFENGFATLLMAHKNDFSGKVITQIDKETSVKSIYCLGKKHRPDMAIDENGIAIELKFITYDELKNAIGQGYFYRLQYKFVFLLLVISEDKKSIYSDITKGKEKDLENLLQHLADNMNIFSYIVPAFSIKDYGVKKCFSFFEPIND